MAETEPLKSTPETAPESKKDVNAQLNELKTAVESKQLENIGTAMLKIATQNERGEFTIPQEVTKLFADSLSEKERASVIQLLQNKTGASALIEKLNALAPAGTKPPERTGNSPVDKALATVDKLISGAQTSIAQKFNIDPKNLDLVRQTALGFFANAAESLAIQFFKFVPKEQRGKMMQVARSLRTVADPNADMTEYDKWLGELNNGETRTFNDWVVWKEKVAQEEKTAATTKPVEAKADGTPEKLADKPVTAKLLDGKEVKVTLNAKDKKLKLEAGDQTREVTLPDSTDMASFTLKQATKDATGSLDYSLNTGTKISLDPAAIFTAVSEKKTEVSTTSGIKIPLVESKTSYYG